MAKKILLTIISFVVLTSLVFPSVASAQEWWNPTFTEFTQKIKPESLGGPSNNEIFGERYTHAQVNWIISSIINILGGDAIKCSEQTDIVNCLTSLLSENNFHPGTLLTLASVTDSLKDTQMASGVDYVAQKIDTLSISPTVYAQGYGYQKSLIPVQKLWQASRNGAYALMTIAVVILAFMVMMRARISPQAVVTVQSSIPKVIMALLFITFSYAIAGLLIDLAFLVQGIIAGVVSSSNGLSGDSALDIFLQQNDGLGSIFAYAISFLIESFGSSGVLARIFRISIGGGQGLNLAGVLAPVDIIIALIVLILLLIAIFRIFWLMLKTQVIIFLLVITSPFFAILGVAQPASNPIGSWTKMIVANLAALITIGLMIMFAHILYFSTGNGQIWLQTGLEAIGVQLNPYNINTQFLASVPDGGRLPSGYGTGVIADVGFFVSLAMMLSVPGIANSIREVVQSGRSRGFAFTDAYGVLGGPIQQGQRKVGESVAGTAGQYGRTAGGNVWNSNLGYRARIGAINAKGAVGGLLSRGRGGGGI